MHRRALLTGAVARLLAPASARAERAAHTARIGILAFGPVEPLRGGLRQALVDLGHVEGRDFVIDVRSAGGRADRLGGMAEDLVRRAVSVIVANATPSVQAAMAATRTIPIVMATAGDALRTGLVASLARPGGNVTGLSLALVELAGKTVEILRESLPALTRIACLVHREDPLHREFLRETELAAPRLGLQLMPVIVDGIAELDGAFTSMTRQRAGAVVVQPIFVVDPATRATVARLALAHRLPSVSGLRRFADAGGLIAYASEFDDVPRRAATYVDRILKGARAGDLPVEQPTHFTLAFNLKTARALGVSIPRELLSRADHVVED